MHICMYVCMYGCYADVNVRLQIDCQYGFHVVVIRKMFVPTSRAAGALITKIPAARYYVRYVLEQDQFHPAVMKLG
jgi:hypothetical protein